MVTIEPLDAELGVCNERRRAATLLFLMDGGRIASPSESSLLDARLDLIGGARCEKIGDVEAYRIEGWTSEQLPALESDACDKGVSGVEDAQRQELDSLIGGEGVVEQCLRNRSAADRAGRPSKAEAESGGEVGERDCILVRIGSKAADWYGSNGTDEDDDEADELNGSDKPTEPIDIVRCCSKTRALAKLAAEKRTEATEVGPLLPAGISLTR